MCANKTAKKRAKWIGKRTRVWIVGILVAAITTVATASLTGFLNNIIPQPDRLFCVLSQHFERSASDNEFAILVANFRDDESDAFSRRVANVIREKTGFTTLRTCRVLEIDTRGDRRKAAEAANERGRRWLRSRNADILVWGNREQEDSFRIDFSVSVDPFMGRLPGDGFTIKSSELETFIAADYGEFEFGMYAVDLALLYGTPFTDDGVDRMQRKLKKLNSFILAEGRDFWQPKLGFNAAHLLASRGTLSSALARETGSTKYAEDAVRDLKSAFRYLKLSPLQAPPEHSSPYISQWRTMLGHALMLQADLSQDLGAAQASIDLWEIKREQWRSDSSHEIDPVLEEALGQSYYIYAKIADDEESRKKAIVAFQVAVENFKERGYLFGDGMRCTTLAGRRHWSGTEARVEDRLAYRLLLELGVSTNMMLRGCAKDTLQ